MENIFNVKPAKVLVSSVSFDGKHATIIVDIYDIKRKENRVSMISGCEILPDGRYKKDVSKRNIGVNYLYF